MRWALARSITFFITKKIIASNTLNTTINKHFRKHRFLNVSASQSYFKRYNNDFFYDLTNLKKEQTDQGDFFLSTSFLRADYSRSNDSAHINYQLGIDANYEDASGNRIIDSTYNPITDFAVFYSFKYRQ